MTGDRTEFIGRNGTLTRRRVDVERCPTVSERAWIRVGRCR